MRYSDEYSKGVLSAHRYHTDDRGRRVWGKRIAYDKDHRGLGAVVVFPGGKRGFFGLSQYTGEVESWGSPPPPRR